MYQCSKCDTKFPTIVSRQKYLVVAEEQLKKIQNDVKDLKKTNTGPRAEHRWTEEGTRRSS